MNTKSHFYPVFFIIAILFLLILAILYVSTKIISKHIEKGILANINQFQNQTELNKNQVVDNLINYCQFLANNKSLTIALELHDPEAIYSILEESNKLLIGGAYLITDGDGNLLTKSDNLNGINKFYELPGISNLINPINPVSHHILNFWNIKREAYIVCTIPIKKKNITIGTLSIGVLISTIFKQSFSERISFALLNKNEVLYSQFVYDNETISKFVVTHHPIVDAILSTSSPSDLFLTKIENNEIFAIIIPFGYELPAFILLSISKSPEFFYLHLLVEYFIYIFILGSLLILLTFYIYAKHYVNQIGDLNLKIQKLNNANEKIEIKEVEDSKTGESISSKEVKEVNGMVLYSKIIILNEPQVSEEVLSTNTINTYLKIQTELIDLYNGKIDSIIDNQIIAFFIGKEDLIEKSLQCSLAIRKLIKNEIDSEKYQVSIGLSYGPLFFNENKQSNLFGKTLKLAEAIVNITNPGQILINKGLIAETDIKYWVGESKVWKFKNFEDEVNLVNVISDKK
jgi:hypothetical protein